VVNGNRDEGFFDKGIDSWQKNTVMLSGRGIVPPATSQSLLRLQVQYMHINNLESNHASFLDLFAKPLLQTNLNQVSVKKIKI